jgi:uncharacterized protein YecT (DUF1311 family)
MRIFPILLFFAGLPATAQDGPSFDCAGASGNAETLVCSDAELAALDRRLAEVYGMALSAAEGLDAGSAEASATLKAMQRGWIAGRDECWKADDARACVAAAYLQREAELVATWILREPYTEAAWICGGNPANEVFVMYFETELPSIRVEYGDGVAPMWQVRAASGARYDGPFGLMFWEHQGAASFVWKDGVEQRCALVAG